VNTKSLKFIEFGLI